MNRIAKHAAVLTALLMGICIGYAASQAPNFALAEVKRSPDRRPVPSGALQSLNVLQSMATTLQSIDARLARVETSLQRLVVQAEQERSTP